MVVFHVHDRHPDFECHVLTEKDPRIDGYKGMPDENCEFQELEDCVVGEGHPYPTRTFAVSKTDPKKYRVFGSTKDAKNAGYQVLSECTKQESWSDYLNS